MQASVGGDRGEIKDFFGGWVDEVLNSSNARNLEIRVCTYGYVLNSSFALLAKKAFSELSDFPEKLQVVSRDAR